MDYEVFLVARMREDYVHSGKARKSIVTGFVGSAKVVTAAAVIMFAVFAAFVPEGDVNMKGISLALAVGIFVDAFIVRMTFVPAVLQLLGDKAWYMPKWLDRVLPHFDVEGEGVQHELELADWPAQKNVVVAAEGLSLKNAEGTRSYFKNLAFTVPVGTTLFVTGSDKIATSALLLTLSGRLDPDTGKLKVADMVLPVRSGAVRSRVALIDVSEHANRNTVAAIEDAASEKPQVIILDNIDFLSSESEQYAVADALNAAREAATKAGRTLTVFVGTNNDMPVETWGNVLSARVDSMVLDLDTVSASSKKVQA
jgi:RND superfamily putative drug exporter